MQTNMVAKTRAVIVFGGGREGMDYKRIWRNLGGGGCIHYLDICSFTDAYLCQSLPCCIFKICSSLTISYTSIKL